MNTALSTASGVAGLVRFAKNLLAIERRTNAGTVDLALLRQGFFSSRRYLYPFDSFPAVLFLTDWEIESRLGRVNPAAWRALVKDKSLVHGLLDRLDPGFAKTDYVGIRVDGRSLHASPDADTELVAKPLGGQGGKRVVILPAGSPGPSEGVFLLEKRLGGHAYARSIFPDTLNTLRIYTAHRRGAGAFILGAAHRFGTQRSKPVDNFKAGGVVSRVGGNGRLSPLVSSDSGASRVTYSCHPDTKAPVEGVAVPFLREARELALRGAALLPDLAYAGWDIAITEEGPVLVELNASLPNPNLLQMHRPLLLDAAARDFFCEVGVIDASRRQMAEAVSKEFGSQGEGF